MSAFFCMRVCVPCVCVLVCRLYDVRVAMDGVEMCVCVCVCACMYVYVCVRFVCV